MNFRYFILTITLIPSIAYTAEAPQKKEDRTLKHQVRTSKHRESLLEKKESSSKPLKKHPKKESATLLDKPKSSLPKELSTPTNTAPVVTHIASLTQLITFNGTTQSLYALIDNREKNKFGLTRVVEVRHDEGNNRIFIDRGTVSLAKYEHNLKKMIARQNAFYISNIEEKESIDYGAIICKEDLSHPASQILQDITITTNFFLLWLIDQRSKELKKLEDEKIHKKKEELQDSQAQLLTDAVQELKTIS